MTYQPCKLRKIALILLFLSISFSSVFAIKVYPSKHQHINISPSSYSKLDYTLNLKKNETVRIRSKNSGLFLTNFNNYFDQSGNRSLKVWVMAPDQPNYNKTFKLVFNSEIKWYNNKSNKTVTNTSETTRKITASVIQPYKEIFSGQVNESNYFTIGNSRYNITRINPNTMTFWLNNKSIEEQTTKKINGFKLRNNWVSQGGYASIDILSKDTTLSVELKTKSVEKEEEKEIKPSIETVTPIQRGNQFRFQIVDKHTGNPIPDAKVILIDTDSGISMEATTGSSGYGSIAVSENIVGRQGKYVVLRVTTHNKTIEKELELGESYGSYASNKPKFNLRLSLNKQEVILGKKASGIVKNKLKESVGGIFITATAPNGDKFEVQANENGKFKFTPENAGNYILEAPKQKKSSGDIEQTYLGSPSINLTILKDSDDDGFPDKNDECTNESGIEELNGCPKKEVAIRVLHKGDQVRNLTVGKSYTVNLINNETDEEINYTGDIKVGGTKYDAREGTAHFSPEERGDTDIEFGGADEYGEASYKVNVEKKIINWKIIAAVFGGIGLLAFIVVALMRKGGGGGKKKKRRKKKKGGGGARTKPQKPADIEFVNKKSIDDIKEELKRS